MPIIIPANSEGFVDPGNFQVTNSCRFDREDADNMSRTPSSAGNRRTFTFSTWVKRTALDGNHTLFHGGPANPTTTIRFKSEGSNGNNSINIYHYSGSFTMTVLTSAQLRDPSAWYHIVVAFDTTQGTASNRVKVYINGVQQTSFLTANYPAQNFDTSINNTTKQVVGAQSSNGDTLGAYLSETIMIDGQQLAPTSFGEFNSDSGIWVPLDDLENLTFGTNGFYLDYKDSSNLGNDVSGNNNDLTETNIVAGNQTQDTCTNNFNVLNLNWFDDVSPSPFVYSGGLTTYRPDDNGNSYSRGTLGIFNKGKWYMEAKVSEVNTGQSSTVVIVPDSVFADPSSGYGFHVQFNGSNTEFKKIVGGTFTDVATSGFSSGVICMLAIDLNGGKMWVGHNGVWYNNNNASTTFSPSNPDGTGISTAVDYLWGFQGYNQNGGSGGYHNLVNLNFGNPVYSISSGNTDGNGFGNFEYAVPPGFLSVCTRNLAEALD